MLATPLRNLYRAIMRQSRAAMPDQASEIAGVCGRVRTAFRDPDQTESALQAFGAAKLAFLRVKTRLRPTPNVISETAGRTRLGCADGARTPGLGPYRDDRIDPEMWARHKRLLDRQHFIGRDLPLRWGEEPGQYDKKRYY